MKILTIKEQNNTSVNPDAQITVKVNTITEAKKIILKYKNYFKDKEFKSEIDGKEVKG